MIERYRRATKRKLERYHMRTAQKQAYMETLDVIIEEKRKRGLSDEQIIARLPDPHALEQELSVHYALKARRPVGEKILMVVPIAVVALYLVVGIVYGTWHPGWMVLLAIPVLAFTIEIIRNKEKPNAWALWPLLVGTAILFWTWLEESPHPAWALVFLVPLVIIISAPPKRTGETVRFSLPFLALSIMVIAGYYTDYAYAWPLALLGVYAFTFKGKHPRNQLLFGCAAIGAALLYFWPVFIGGALYKALFVWALPFAFKDTLLVRYAPLKSVGIIGVFLLYTLLAHTVNAVVAPSVFIVLLPLRRSV